MNVISPTCTIIAGPNGSGKTTFALRYLATFSPTKNFVNADLIASGLSPLNPEKGQLEASRLFLAEIQNFIQQKESFAFETTLSGRSYLRMIRNLRSEGWDVQLIYLWLPSVEACRERVAERVRTGGHSIPAEVIERRFFRSIRNLLFEYASECSSVIVYRNDTEEPLQIFTASLGTRIILAPADYAYLIETAKP